MRIERTYIAFDETEFSDKEECLTYEKYIRENMKAAIFYDDEREVVDVEKEGTGNAYYIRIVNAKKAPALFRWLNDQFGMEHPKDDDYEDGDLYVYDCDHDEWVNLTAQKKFIEKVESFFNKKEGEEDS